MRPTPDELARPWWDEDGFWHGLHTLFDPVRVPFFRAALSAAADHRIRLLDLGSGAGFVAVGLSDIATVTAIDVTDTIRQARTAGLANAVQGDGRRLPFRTGIFDAVVCSEVLEHTTDPQALVAESSRVLRPGGLLLFSMPTRTRWSRLVLIDAAQRWRATRVLPDLHGWEAFLTPAELTTMLADNGFSTRRLTGIGIKARPWPATLTALALLKAGRISYAEAGRRIRLTIANHTRLGMIGYAERRREG